MDGKSHERGEGFVDLSLIIRSAMKISQRQRNLKTILIKTKHQTNTFACNMGLAKPCPTFA